MRPSHEQLGSGFGFKCDYKAVIQLAEGEVPESATFWSNYVGSVDCRRLYPFSGLPSAKGFEFREKIWHIQAIFLGVCRQTEEVRSDEIL